MYSDPLRKWRSCFVTTFRPQRNCTCRRCNAHDQCVYVLLCRPWTLFLQLLAGLALHALAQDEKSSVRLATIHDVQLFEPIQHRSSDLYGSQNGGTRLALLGNNLLNPDGSFDNSIVVFIAGQQATVIPFLSTAWQVVIDTPAVPYSTPSYCHQIQVWG